MKEKFNFAHQLLFTPIMYFIAVLKIVIVIPVAIIALCNYVLEQCNVSVN